MRSKHRARARVGSLSHQSLSILAAHHGSTLPRMSWSGSSWRSPQAWGSSDWGRRGSYSPQWSSSGAWGDRPHSSWDRKDDSMDAASSAEGHQTALKKAQWELRNHRGVGGAHANASRQQLIETIRRERHAIMAKSDIWTKHSAYSRRIETIDRLVLEAEATISKAREKIASLQHERLQSEQTHRCYRCQV